MQQKLDLILRAELPARLEDNKPVSPTLLIGLGGTGKEVLLRLRRLIVERYGSLSALPFLQFMHLDTDCTATAKEQYNLKAGDDPLHPEVRFVPAERIDLTIEGGTGKYIEHINAYPHIKRWFPTSGKIAHLGNLGEGAGQVRVASRLGFFHAPNFTKISSRLEQCKALLKDASIMKKVAGLGFEFDPNSTNVFVIASLAGGTGGGTFLDMGFLLQRHFPSAERVGILLLPSFFKDYAGGERVRANGFASLMELNHFAFGHSFYANWDGHRAETLPPPPYSTTYLIDGMNEAGLVIGSSGKEYDAYQMVAETLFQDYSIGKFAGMKRATRINLVNFNLNVYTHNFLNEALRSRPQDTNKTIVGDTYPTRFGSFGLASIFFPTDRLHSAAACRLASRILEFWEKSLLDDPLESLFTNFLTHEDVRFAQGRYERKDGGGILERQDIEEALLVYDSGSSRTFQSYLWNKAQTIRTDIENAPRGQKAAVLAEQRSLLEQFLAKEDSDNPDEWGVGVRQVDANMRAYLERTKNGIQKRASELANDSRLGVAYTLSLLQQLKQILRSETFPYLAHFEAGIPMWRDEIQTWAFELDQIQMEVGRHERQLLFRGADLERDLERLVADEKSEDLGVLYNYLYSRVMKQVCKRGKLICEEIDQFLGKDDPTGKGLIGQYYSLLAGFGKLKDRLHAKERYFTKAEKYELTISLYREEDLPVWYRKWVGETAQETEVFRTVGNQLLKTIFQVDSVTAALAHIQRTPIDTIEENVLAHCKKYLASHAEQPEALSILLESNRFTLSEREEMIRRAYNLAKIWLRRPEQGLEHTGLNPVSADQRPCLIGVDTGNVPRLEELKRLIQEIQTPGDSQPAFLNLGTSSKGMIVFYNELAGVPAFYPQSVTSPNGLRQAYDTYPDKDELHIDKNRFQFGDLIPKTTDEARRYADSLKAFVLSRVLGLLRVKEIRDDSEHLTFHYSFKREEGLRVDDIQLGDELNAVDFLYRDKRAEHHTDRQYLLRQVEKAIETLQARQLLWVYGLLIEFYLKKVYPPSTDQVSGVAHLTFTKYPAEHAVLARAHVHLERMLPSEEELKALSQSIQGSRGKPQGEDLSHEEFVAALAPYCKSAGKYAEKVVSTAEIERATYREVLALDLGKIDGGREKEAAPLPVQILSEPRPAERVAERNCPQCGQRIDARATFCRHCRRVVAQHVTCPTCGETKVPDDSEHCWKCGGRMRQGQRMDCPQCFGWKGYESEFPCPVCGFDPAAPPEPAPRATVAAPSAASVPANGGNGSGGGGYAAPVPDMTSASASLVECPTCYSMVQVGPRCSVCQNLLDAN